MLPCVAGVIKGPVETGRVMEDIAPRLVPGPRTIIHTYWNISLVDIWSVYLDGSRRARACLRVHPHKETHCFCSPINMCLYAKMKYRWLIVVDLYTNKTRNIWFHTDSGNCVWLKEFRENTYCVSESLYMTAGEYFCEKGETSTVYYSFCCFTVCLGKHTSTFIGHPLVKTVMP